MRSELRLSALGALGELERTLRAVSAASGLLPCAVVSLALAALSALSELPLMGTSLGTGARGALEGVARSVLVGGGLARLPGHVSASREL